MGQLFTIVCHVLRISSYMSQSVSTPVPQVPTLPQCSYSQLLVKRLILSEMKSLNQILVFMTLAFIMSPVTMGR